MKVLRGVVGAGSVIKGNFVMGWDVVDRQSTSGLAPVACDVSLDVKEVSLHYSRPLPECDHPQYYVYML